MSFLITLVSLFVPAPESPRYHFQPGLELNYTCEITATSKEADKKPQSAESTFQVTVLKKNDDGSYRLLVLGKLGKAPNYHWDVRRVDMRPDGQVINESEPLNSFSVNLLPPLPGDTSSSWTMKVERDQASSSFKPSGFKDNQFFFHEDRSGGMLGIYDAESSYDYIFDTRQGFITSVTGQHIKSKAADHVPYKYGGGGSTFSVKLVSQNQVAPDTLTSLAKEVDALVTLKDDELRDYKKGSTVSEADATKLMQANENRWKEARPLFKHTGLSQVVDNGIKTSSMYVRYIAENAKRRADMIGKEPPAWQAKDFEGIDYSNEKLRGKIVVLDFWYRGCGWCLRAMPQMIQLSDDFKGKDVVILGVNIDEDPEDARFVIKRFKLNYPSLDFAKLSTEKNRHPLLSWTFGYPTLLVIDKEGKLADIHVGYSPVLRQEVTESIKKAMTR